MDALKFIADFAIGFSKNTFSYKGKTYKVRNLLIGRIALFISVFILLPPIFIFSSLFAVGRSDGTLGDKQTILLISLFIFGLVLAILLITAIIVMLFIVFGLVKKVPDRN